MLNGSDGRGGKERGRGAYTPRRVCLYDGSSATIMQINERAR